MHCSRSQSSYKGVMHSSNWKSANLISCHPTLSEQQQQHLFLPAAPLIHPVLSCDSLPRGKGSTMVPASYAACLPHSALCVPPEPALQNPDWFQPQVLQLGEGHFGKDVRRPGQTQCWDYLAGIGRDDEEEGHLCTLLLRCSP